MALTVRLFVILVASIISGSLFAVNDPEHRRSESFANPIIRGFAPDPSIVRVGSDFYLVNSTFEYFPAIPVYHSRDLVNWSLIGHAVQDPSSLNLDHVESSGGVQAATIRYSKGRFYVVFTCIVGGKVESYLTKTRDPGGQWERPRLIKDAEGIDPSLFFDDDGKVWYTANRLPKNPDFPGQAEIWLQEIDVEAGQLLGIRYPLSRGCCNGVWAEGPHLYKRNGVYYLLMAEGGTLYEHSVTVAVSDSVTGPYTSNPRNPVLTHRNLSYDYPITGVGHADLVELADGRWYAVALGWRMIDGRHGILGRETFLVPVTWETEREWWRNKPRTYPVFSPETGRIELHYPRPFPHLGESSSRKFADDFKSTQLSAEWSMRRSQSNPFYELDPHKGLVMKLLPGRIKDAEQYSFLGVRQRDFRFGAEAELLFNPRAEEEAGMIVIMSDHAAITLTVCNGVRDRCVRLSRWSEGSRKDLAEVSIRGGATRLKIEGNDLTYRFFALKGNGTWIQVGPVVDGTFMSPAVIKAYNYTGINVGIYASSNGAATTNMAVYHHFDYRPMEQDPDRWFSAGQVHSKAQLGLAPVATK